MTDNKNALKETINARRSTRKYKADPVPQDLLAEVIEAGRMAPTGNNTQTIHFIAVTKPEHLAELCEAVTAVMAATPVQESMPAPMVGMINKAKQETLDVHYGAPALILTANKKGYDNAAADCSCAMENMMLMATACGLGNCWINLYHRLRQAPPLRSLMEKLGLQPDEEVFGALVLGVAENLETTPLPRKGNPVTYA